MRARIGDYVKFFVYGTGDVWGRIITPFIGNEWRNRRGFLIHAKWVGLTTVLQCQIKAVDRRRYKKPKKGRIKRIIGVK